jgi:hypothetical protein
MSRKERFILYGRIIDRVNDLAQSHIISPTQHDAVVTEILLDCEETKDAPEIRPLREPLRATVEAHERLQELQSL